MNDENIIQLLWVKDEMGIIELKKKYDSRLYNLSKHFLSNEDAEECVNDTYLKLWNSIPPNYPKQLFAYAMKICRNQALNKIQWNNALKRKMETVALSKELEECIPTKRQESDMQGLAQLLSEFLKKLPKEHRIFFVRRYWYGERIKEIALGTQMSESKIKSVLFRTRKKLKKYLEQEGINL